MLLSNDLLNTRRVEQAIAGGFACGSSMLVVHALFNKQAKMIGGRTEKVFVELQRKSFHMIGGMLICAGYHWGIKKGILTPAYVTEAVKAPKGAVDAASAFMSMCFVSWMIEASRLMIPSVQQWYTTSFQGLIREKELTKAAGIAYFLPGALAAMMAAPPKLAILGILCLSIGDAGASIGTAAGRIPVGSSSRKVEGSIACFLLCSLLGKFTGLSGKLAMTSSLLVSLGEVLAEVIGLDDNLVIPMLSVVGLRIAMNPQLKQLLSFVGVGLGAGIALGAGVATTTRKKALTG